MEKFKYVGKIQKEYRTISALITILFILTFAGAASLFVINYNSLFTNETMVVKTDVGSSNAHGNRIILNMETSDISDEIPDSELKGLNTYGFPQGDSPYFIYVEKGAHTISAFGKDNYGFYTNRIATWYTAIGKTDSFTPVGVFSVGKKEEWHTWPAGTFSPYATIYSNVRNHYGGLFIHGPIYFSKNFYSVSGNSVMNIGKNCSSGCLRTETEAAYFVYKMCPEGTKVKIVDGSPLGFTPYRNVYISNQQTAPNIEKFQLVSITPDKIAFAEESHTMVIGDIYCPKIVSTPSYARNIDCTWSSNNPDILKVSGNTILAVGTGSAMLYLTSDDGKLSASMLINVTADSVDTSADPPDVQGKNTDLSDDDILENYEQISMDLLKLKINGRIYGLDENVVPLLRELGIKDYKVESYQSCAYVGLDKSYTYTHMANGKVGKCVISTVPMIEGEDNICEISIKNVINADLETTKGIKLGSSRADVEKTYGKYYTETLVENGDNDSYIKMTYWAGIPNKSGQPSLYFYLNYDSGEVIGMGIYSGRNFI